jgi:hypothetical protein
MSSAAVPLGHRHSSILRCLAVGGPNFSTTTSRIRPSDEKNMEYPLSVSSGLKCITKSGMWTSAMR